MLCKDCKWMEDVGKGKFKKCSNPEVNLRLKFVGDDNDDDDFLLKKIRGNIRFGIEANCSGDVLDEIENIMNIVEEESFIINRDNEEITGEILIDDNFGCRFFEQGIKLKS